MVKACPQRFRANRQESGTRRIGVILHGTGPVLQACYGRSVVAAMVVLGLCLTGIELAAAGVLESAPPAGKLRVAVIEFEDTTLASEDESAVNLGPNIQANCLAQSLQGSELFQLGTNSIDRPSYALAIALPWDRIAKEFETLDLLITGRLLLDREVKTDLKARKNRVLMPLFVFPVLLGFPDEWWSRDVAFELQVRLARNPYQVLYEDKIQVYGADSGVRGLYYGKSFLGHGCSPGLENDLARIRAGIEAALQPGGAIAAALHRSRAEDGPSGGRKE